MRNRYPIYLGSLGVCLPWHHHALRWDTVAPLPALLSVLMQASWSLLGQRHCSEPSNATRDVEKVVVQNNTERGEWLGKTKIKKWSNQWWGEFFLGVSGLEKMLPCFLVDFFFIRVD